MLDLQENVAGLAGARREKVLKLAAHHHGDERARVHFGKGPGAHEPAVLEHGNRIADLEDLVHPVRDVDDRLAGIPQASDVLVENLDVRGIERSGRFVQDEDRGIRLYTVRDFHELALSDRQLGNQRPGLQIEPEIDQRALRVGIHASIIEAAEARARLAAEKEVFGNSQIGQERQLLKHGRYAEFESFARIGE